MKISKGHNSIRNVGGVTVLVLFPLSDDYICTKFHENFLKGFRAIEWTQFP